MTPKKIWWLWSTLLLCCFLIHCSTSSSSTDSADDADDNDSEDTTGSASLENVASWLYQLQNMDVDEIGDSAFDLAVIDYSTDGSDDEALSEEDINTMKGSSDSEKLVLAYMSIGEAEDYRYYFDADADYVDEENPDWPGNYKVHYWEEAWQSVIESYIDRLIAAGFDGAYLDIIDAYEYYGPGGDSGVERESAADDMVNFVIRIAAYARESNSDFLVFPQNGSGIINDSSLATEYFDAINGIGAEDTFYFGDEDVDNDLDEQADVIENLNAFRDAGKTVLSVDYLTEADKIDDYYERALESGYIPYATVRDLDAFTMNTGHEPE